MIQEHALDSAPTRLLIARSAEVLRAMQQLEATESKALYVVDDDDVLYGSLTDGDLRRWILAGGKLDAHVEKVCNTSPIVASADARRDEVKQVMLANGITSIPVVDETRRVTAVLLWADVFVEEADAVTERRAIDLPVVIMAGGFGTRLRPFTTVLPKPLIPIRGRTVVEIIIDSFTAHGVDDFYMSVNYKSKIIESYFDDLSPDYSMRFIHEDEPLGTAGSLSKLVGTISTDFVVTNCDVIVSADYYDLARHHREKENDITLVVSLKNYTIPYGVCEIGNGGTLLEIREKPQFNYLVNTGLYVVKPWVLELIPPGEHFHFTDLIEAVKAEEGRVGVFPIADTAWLDTGEWPEYRAAVANLTADRRRTN